jgi:hypothetical protein
MLCAAKKGYGTKQHLHFFDFCTQQALAEEADAAQVAAGGNPFEIGTSTNVLCK